MQKYALNVAPVAYYFIDNELKCFESLDRSQLLETTLYLNLILKTRDEKLLFISNYDFKSIDKKYSEQDPKNKKPLCLKLSNEWKNKLVLLVSDLPDLELSNSNPLHITNVLNNEVVLEAQNSMLDYNLNIHELSKRGIYIQGNSYHKSEFVLEVHNIHGVKLNEIEYIIPLENIYSSHDMTSKEFQKILTFNENGKFIEILQGNNLIY